MDKRRSQTNAGNIFLAIFGAVAVAGVLSASVATFMQGPLKGSVQLSRQSRAETQMNIAGQMAIMATTNAIGADCDSDGMVEALGWRLPGSAPSPVGGGLLPMELGISKKDPWGTEYGYCVWDHGAAILSPTCQTAGANNRLEGVNSSNYPVIAIISAGPDKTFSTTCRPFSTGATRADVNNNGVLTDATDLQLVSKTAGTDDVIFVKNYEQASLLSGGLWTLKAGDPAQATIGKNLEVAGGASFTGTGSFKRLAASSNDYLEVLNGLKLASPSGIATCSATNNGALRLDAAGTGIEMCGSAGWGPITSSVEGSGSGGSGGGGSGTGTGTPDYFVQLNGGAAGTSICGIKVDNSLWCWGQNNYGQFGDGTTTDRNVPTKIGSDGWAKLGLGRESACGIKADGTAYCWGLNESGRFGNNSEVDSLVPVPVNGGGTWLDIAGEYRNFCGIKTGGTGYCWGSWSGPHGQTSQPGDSLLIPTAISGGGTWKKITVGSGIACGIKSNDSAWCWGSTFSGSSLGNGTTNSSNPPVQVSETGPWSQISSGGGHVCAIKSDQTLWCWGNNQYGALGIGSTTNKNVPTQVAGNWSKIVAGNGYSCGIKTDGTLWCWGSNSSGGVGDGSTTNRLSPVQVQPSDRWIEIAMSNGTTCGIKDTLATSCWGYNYYGTLGNGTTGSNTTTPGPITETVVTGNGFFPMKAPGGSAGAPSYSFLNSPTSGMWYGSSALNLQSADKLNFLASHVNFKSTATDFRIASSGGIKIGNDTATCDNSIEGTIRYGISNTFEYCNGTAWTDLKRTQPDPAVLSKVNVFVTSTTSTGALGGLAGADAACQNLAETAGLKGLYMAWLSDSTGAAATRQKQHNLPYALVDGTVIANNWADLIDGTLIASINKTQTGAAVTAPLQVFTASNANGTLNGSHCTNWTSGASGQNGEYGTSGQTNANWTKQASPTTANRRCNTAKRLICIQQSGEEDGGGFVADCDDYYSSVGLENVAALADINAIAYIPGLRQAVRLEEYINVIGNTSFAGGRDLITACVSGTGSPSIVATTNSYSSSPDRNKNKLPLSPRSYYPTFYVNVPAMNSNVSGKITFGTAVDVGYTLTTQPPPRLAFTTSALYNGNLGGLAGADAKCQAAADSSPLMSQFGRSWKAMLSDSTVDVRDRMNVLYPVVRTNGEIAFSADIWSGSGPAHPNYLLFDELGRLIDATVQRYVWTGSTDNGVKVASQNCSDWTSSSSSVQGYYGHSDSSLFWFEWSGQGCNNLLRLYCMSQ